MKNYFPVALIMIISSAHAEKFPAELTCNTGEQISLKTNGIEQRIAFTSSQYGTFNGYFDVFKGEYPEGHHEALADIHGMGDSNGSPMRFSLTMKLINGIIDFNSINYSYFYMSGGEIITEDGQCMPVKDGGFIEGDKHY